MKVKVAQSCSTLCNPMNYTVHGILEARILEWVAFPFSRGSSQPRYRTQVSHIAGRFFTSWAQGKLKNTGGGSLSLLQRIFPTQESNWGSCIAGRFFTNCAMREALNYEGRPSATKLKKKEKRQSFICFSLSLKPLKIEHSPSYPKTWHKFVWDRTWY